MLRNSIDAEWEVADDALVTEVQPRLLMHRPRPTPGNRLSGTWLTE